MAISRDYIGHISIAAHTCNNCCFRCIDGGCYTKQKALRLRLCGIGEYYIKYELNTKIKIT